MQNILVPTDFSGNAYHALRYATELLKNKECTFFLLNVYGIKKGFKSKPTDNSDEQISDTLRIASEKKLKTTLKKIKEDSNATKHSYALLSKSSDLIHAVQSLIDELKIDLVVLGNKGETSSIPLFLGSTTTRALESVKKCPILTVPQSANLDIPGEIAFATDFKKEFNTDVLNAVRSMALLCGAAVRVVHIDEGEGLNELQKANRDILLNHLEPMDFSVDKIPHFISKTKIIQVFAENSGIKILAMVQNDHGELEKMLREPVIEKMVGKIDIPYCIIPDAS